MDPFAPSYPTRPVHYDPDATTLRVAAILHKYPPFHGAGAEWMAHGLLRELARRGHEVTVFITHPLRRRVRFQGVVIDRWRHPQQLAAVSPHVCVTHLDLTRYAVHACQQSGIPLIHLLHNHRQLQFHRVRPADAALCVANSQWIREVYADWDGPMVVIPPPVEVAEYERAAVKGDRVALLNLSPAKGGPLFWELAARMPHRRFLAVHGAYAHQEVPPVIPSNVVVLENTPRVVDEVYAWTKVLLMPSSYESWGRCGIEAACSGIPTIAHPTQGLVESLGSSGVWADRDAVDQWVDAIDCLFDDPAEYKRRSAMARARAEELDPSNGDYDRWDELVRAVVHGDVAARC